MTTATASTATDTVRRLYADIEAGRSGDDLRPHFTDAARTLVRPNTLAPHGRIDDLASMLAASAQGARLLTWQRYDLWSILEVDSLVVTRLRWRGEVAVDAGPFTVGQQLTADIAQFIRVEDGRIAEIETYDCYQPLG